MKLQILTALKFLLIMTILTGVIYPLFMTALAQLTYPSKANGSMLTKDGRIVGSVLIGQSFDSTIYFWSRPSITDYNPLRSGGSNYGPTSETLKKLVASRLEIFTKLNSIAQPNTVPKEMIFASGSGLDPHISPYAAMLQVDRISKARHFDNSQKQLLLNGVKNLSEKPQFYILGEERINVLLLNLELEEIEKSRVDHK